MKIYTNALLSAILSAIGGFLPWGTWRRPLAPREVEKGFGYNVIAVVGAVRAAQMYFAVYWAEEVQP